MSLPTYAKALVAAVVTAVGPLATSVLTSGAVTSKSGLAAAILAALGGGATYAVPNGKRPDLAGLVVTVKTDADEFVKNFLAGLPGLVGSSMKAALVQPTPTAVPAPVAPAPVAPAPAPAAPAEAPVAAPAAPVAPAVPAA